MVDCLKIYGPLSLTKNPKCGAIPRAWICFPLNILKGLAPWTTGTPTFILPGVMPIRKMVQVVGFTARGLKEKSGLSQKMLRLQTIHL